MAFGTTTTSIVNTNDTTFRAWIQMIHDILIAVGMVDNGDAGQLDLSTATAPIATNTVAGFRMYRSNDAAGDLTNFTAKVEFGSAPWGTQYGALWFSFSFGGSDGAGNLEGNVSARQQIFPQGIPSGGTSVVWSGDMNVGGGGRVVISHTTPTHGHCLKISFERTLNQGDYSFRNEVTFHAKEGSSSPYHQTIRPEVVFPSYNSGQGDWMMPPSANTPVNGEHGFGAQVAFAPGFTAFSRNLIGMKSGSWGAYGDVVTLPIYGQLRRYKISRDVDAFYNRGTTTYGVLYE